jgi:hypothetical protein
MSGVGVEIFPVPGDTDHAECYEGADIAVYKG